jgi:hypothetical protein
VAVVMEMVIFVPMADQAAVPETNTDQIIMDHQDFIYKETSEAMLQPITLHGVPVQEAVEPVEQE